MNERWIEETTLGEKHKSFKWRYSSDDGIVIRRVFNNEEVKNTTYTISEIDKIFEYVEDLKKVRLANSVHKVPNGTEIEGLGKFAYEVLHKDVVEQQATSQLVSIFVKADIFGWNGAKKKMEFWIKHKNWQSRIECAYNNQTDFHTLNFKLNHITISVSDLDISLDFYSKAFGAEILAKGEKLAYFDLSGMWIALNLESHINRSFTGDSYTHIAFELNDLEIKKFIERLDFYNIDYLEGRPRTEYEGESVYIRDPDGHLFEVHTRTRMDRLSYYNNEKDDIEVYGVI